MVAKASLADCIYNAVTNLAIADEECVMPFSPQARQLDEAVKILESINCQDEANVFNP